MSINSNIKNKIIKIERMLIVCDLDGTLLHAGGVISKFTEKIIKKITSQGHVFCLATGRPLRAAVNYYKQLGLNSLLVNYNGSYISNPSNTSYTPLNLGFSNHVFRKIIKNKKIINMVENIIVENTEGNFVWRKPRTDQETQILWKHFHIDNSVKYSFIKKDLSNIKADVHSILINLKSEEYINDLVLEIRSITNTLIVRNWSIPSIGTIIEINSMFSQKNTALKYLSSYYGIPLENCIAFGDGDNDANMLKTSFFGFAMKNGDTVAKLAARYITHKTNNEDGVACSLKSFFNIK